MPREWFELEIDGGLPSYTHSGTGRKLARRRTMLDAEWSDARQSFMATFPGVTGIMLPGGRTHRPR